MLRLLSFVLLFFGFHSLKFEYNGVQPRCIIRRQNRMEFSREHPVKFCEVYNYAEDKCVDCFDGYSLFGSRCLLDDTNLNVAPILIARNPFCEKYNSKDKCIACYEGYAFRDGQCDTETESTLNSDFILQSLSLYDHELCQELLPSGKCLSCFTGAEMKNGRCSLPDYRQYSCRNQNTCYPIVTACRIYSRQGFCKMCEEGSVNMNGQCRLIKRGSLCEAYNQRRQCVKCTSYATMAKGKCIYRQPFCNREDQRGMCLECNKRSMLHNGQCHLYTSSIPFLYSEPNCVSWKDGSCFQCAFGWKLTFTRLCRPLQ